MADFQWFKDGDADFFTCSLTTDGSAQDLTGATCTLVCSLFEDGALPLAIVSAETGVVRAHPTLAQLTAATTGTARARIRVEFASGEVAYFPRVRALSVEIGVAP